MDTTFFPFTAIIGQEALKTALLINAVDPGLGGVLIRGHKGAGKSTAARALAGLLPMITAVRDCPYHCDPTRSDTVHTACAGRITAGEMIDTIEIATPMVELPLATTEDRIVGTLNLETAVTKGVRQFDPGLLAAANRGILYVDEVNLLADHLVDLLLDAAASGVNIVEREGLRHVHPARFMLIGTMNPEEGELRPQFLDRFGLSIHIETINDAQQRKQIILSRIAFETNPEDFCRTYEPAEEILRKQVTTARRSYRNVLVPEAILEAAVEIAITAEVQGHRAEITLVRGAKALAALLDRPEVGFDELQEVARLVLPHRLAANPLERPKELDNRVEDILARTLGIKERKRETLDEEDLYFIDNHGFPGSAAAGSMLFTYLKKKIPIAPLNRTTS